MIPYILHVSILISCFFLLYKFLLEKETFFQLNRWLLMGSIALSFALPLLHIPQTWSIWQAEPQATIVESIPSATVEPTTSITTPMPPIIKNANPIEETREMVVETQVPTKSLLSEITWIELLWGAYFIGVGIFGVNLLIQLFTLFYKRFTLPSLNDDGIRIVELGKDEPPFSFLKSVFINPEKYDWDTYNQIIEHEKIHIQQMHSLDMIVAELLVVLQWFNPAAWYYRKAIENNLEFLTDATMLHQGAKRESYQINLLRVSVPQYPIGLAMNYNQSTLKKRIKMMNVKKSSVRSSWKYLTMFPVLGLSIVCLNAVQAEQQQLQNDQLSLIDLRQETDVLNTSAVEINAQQEQINNATTQVESNTATDAKTEADSKVLQDAKVESQMETSWIGAVKGNWYAEADGSDICIKFDMSDIRKRHMWNAMECFPKSDFTGLNASSGTTKIRREAGEVDFLGTISGGEGFGKFEFTPSESFKSFLKQKGYSSYDDKELFHLFIADINKAYFDYMKQQGYTDISKDNLIALAVHGLDMDYLKKQLPVIKARGFDSRDVDQLIALRIHGVTSEYIDEMASVGFKDLALDDLMAGKIHGVNVDYVKEIRAMGYDDLEFQDFIAFRIHGVSKELTESLKEAGFDNLSAEKVKSAAIHGVRSSYIEEMSKVGFADLSLDDLINGRIHGVSTSYVKEIRAMGYTDLAFQDFIDFRIHGVSESVAQSLKDIGFNDLSASKIKSASIHGVSANYIKGIRDAGYNLTDINELIEFKIHGVSTSFIKEMNDMGYTDLSAGQIKSAAIHGVSSDFVKGFHDLGFKDISIDEAVELRIHGVSPSFIKRARAKGMTDLSLDKYKQLKIHGIVD